MRKTLIDWAEGSAVPDILRDTQPMQKRTATTPRVNAYTPPLSAITGEVPEIVMEAEGTDNKSTSPEQNSLKSSDETVPALPIEQLRARLAEKTDAKDKPNILIIEDTLELAEVIQATLESVGMKAEFVSHGAKGLEKIKAQAPDVLLLDIGLPDMTGWKMLEELREWQSENHKMPPVIVITAYGDPANRLIGKLQGIHSYLIKPFTPEEVEKVVLKALAVS